MKTAHIVNDSRAVRERLIAMIIKLEGNGLTDATRELKETAKTIRLLHSDLGILGIRIPGMSGIQVLKGIKQEFRAPVAIMLTSYPFRQYRRESAQAGTDYFLNKSPKFKKIDEILAGIVRADSHSENQ